MNELNNPEKPTASDSLGSGDSGAVYHRTEPVGHCVLPGIYTITG